MQSEEAREPAAPRWTFGQKLVLICLLVPPTLVLGAFLACILVFRLSDDPDAGITISRGDTVLREMHELGVDERAALTSRRYSFEAGFAGDHSDYCAFDAPLDLGWSLVEKYADAPRSAFARWEGRSRWTFVVPGPAWHAERFRTAEWDLANVGETYFFETWKDAPVILFAAIDVTHGRVFFCSWSGGAP